MSLTQDQEDLEHDRTMIAMKADVELTIMQAEMEPWKLVAAVFVSFGGAAGGAVGYVVGMAQHH